MKPTIAEIKTILKIAANLTAQSQTTPSRIATPSQITEPIQNEPQYFDEDAIKQPNLRGYSVSRIIGMTPQEFQQLDPGQKRQALGDINRAMEMYFDQIKADKTLDHELFLPARGVNYMKGILEYLDPSMAAQEKATADAKAKAKQEEERRQQLDAPTVPIKKPRIMSFNPATGELVDKSSIANSGFAKIRSYGCDWYSNCNK